MASTPAAAVTAANSFLSELERDLPPNDRPPSVNTLEERWVNPEEALRYARVSGRGRKAQTDVPEHVNLSENAILNRPRPAPATLAAPQHYAPVLPSGDSMDVTVLSSGTVVPFAIGAVAAASSAKPAAAGKKPRGKGAKAAAAAAAAPATSDGGGKRTRRPKRSVPPDMVNPAFITPSGTLTGKVAGNRSAVNLTPALMQNRRRHQMSAIRALTFPRLNDARWRPPNLDRPIEARAELNTQIITQGPGILTDPNWIGRDAITGLAIEQLRNYDPEMAARTLPMSDFHERFNRESPYECNMLHARLVSKLYGYEGAMYESVQMGRNPALRTASSSALLTALLTVGPAYERMQALLAVENIDGHLRQCPLPSVPELLMSQIKTFLRPPNLPNGERACVAGARCSASNSAHDPDACLTSPFQWGPGNQRAQKHREQIQVLQLREFLTAEQEAAFAATKELPAERGFCIVCHIHATNIKYFASVRQCTNDRDYQWMIDVVQRYENGEIGSDEMRAELHDTTKRCDILELTRRFAGFQPFKVRIGEGEFPTQACLNIVVGTHETAALYPFPIYDQKLFRWVRNRDVCYMEMDFPNFCFGMLKCVCVRVLSTVVLTLSSHSPDDNPWGVSQLWPPLNPREAASDAAIERVSMLSLGVFYQGLAQLEVDHPEVYVQQQLAANIASNTTGSAAISEEELRKFATKLKVGAEGAYDLLHNQYVLCPFEQTVQAFRDGLIKPRTPREYNVVWFPVHPDKGCFPADEPLQMPDFAILAALAHRLSMAYTEYHRLMSVRRTYFTDAHPDTNPTNNTNNSQEAASADKASPRLENEFGDMSSFYEYLDILHDEQCDVYNSQHALRRACFHWKLYMTTHFQLAHYLWLRPLEPLAWSDTALLTQPDSHTLCPYEAFYPDEHRAIGVGILPRLTHVMANLGWFREATSEKKVPLSHLFRKSLNVICAVRGWSKILDEYCTKYDGIVELLNLCTMVSCLRLYPHSDECFTMDMAMHVWHHFNSSALDPEANRAWRAKHSILMWFSLREYQLYLTKQLPPLFYVLTRYNNLPAVAASCSAGLDHACQIFVKYGAFVVPERNIDVNHMLRLGYYNSQQLRFAFKVFKTSFLEMASGMLNTLFDQHYFTDRNYCYANTVSDEVAALMRAYVSRLDANAGGIMQMHHFQHWDIHPVILRLLFACKDNYEIGCEADHKTRKQLEGVFSCAPRDFHLLHMLCITMVRHCRIQLIPLSAETAEAQERALRVRHGIADYRVPRPALYNSYFCPVCECVCCFITPPCWLRSNRTDFSGFNIVNHTGDSGHDHARWDVHADQLVCRRPTMVKGQSFQEAKQQHARAGGKLVYRGHDRIDPNAPQREAREVRKTRFASECRNTPLVRVCFIGAALRIGPRIIVACETDFAKTELSLGTFGPRGITCTAHTHDPWAHLRPFSLLYDRFGPLPLPANPNLMPDNLILATRGLDWDILLGRDVRDNRFCNHYGVMKQLDAMLRLVQARSQPNNGTNAMSTTATSAIAAAASSAASAAAAASTQVTNFGSIRTLATVGYNTFVNSLLQGTYQNDSATEHITRYANACFFCSHRRPKNDIKWCVTAAWDGQIQLMLVFVCDRCTYMLPSIMARGVAPHLTFDDLITMKRTKTPVTI